MPSNTACSKLPPIAFAIAMISLSGCAAGGSEPSGGDMCPPVVEYSQALRESAAQEVDTLPEVSALAGMLSDYAVMRQQARACHRV